MMGLSGKLFSDLIVSSIGWTLLHSIWQGLIITILMVLLALLLKKSAAHIRYLMGVGMLIVMVLVSLATFVMVYQSGIERGTIPSISMEKGSNPVETATGGFFIRIKTYFDRNLPAVVTLWLMGMLFFFLKFVNGVLVTQRLRHHQTREVSRFWKRRLSELSRKLNIKSAVDFRESLAIGIPLTFGFLKPLILFPMGMLSQMPRDQVEALVVHELAHILRKDYIVNIFQNLVDIIYFYHPGVCWISQQVRMERENCCDDITVNQVGDSLTIARALTRAGEFSLNYKDGLAMAASRDSSRLLMRIRRLFPMKNERSRPMAGLFGFLLMVVFAGSLMLWLNASCRLFAGSENPGAKSEVKEVKKEVPDNGEVRRLRERHKELAAREAVLTRKEKKELQEIETKLMAIKEMEEKKKLQSLALELERLKAKTGRTEEENLKLEKLTQFLEQSRSRMANTDISLRIKELQERERELYEAEQAELRRMEEKLKQHQIEENLKREEEKKRMEFKLQESLEKERQIREEKRRLMEQETELKRMELKKEYQRLGKEIHRLSKQKKLTDEEKDQLKKLKEKQEQIKQLMETR